MIHQLIVKLFFGVLRKDKVYRLSWHDNLAMMAFDAGAGHKKANQQAGRFMRNLIGIDTYREWIDRLSQNGMDTEITLQFLERR